MARYRVNPNAICSSKNYKQSKKLHIDMVKRNHEIFVEMVTKGEIIIKKQAFVRVFGKLVAVSSNEITILEKTMTIIWK